LRPILVVKAMIVSFRAGHRPKPSPASSSNRVSASAWELIMYKRGVSAGLSLFAIIGVMALLSACHTTAGAGRDISQTGKAITNSANNNTP
jgi:predicted small secreted protein